MDKNDKTTKMLFQVAGLLLPVLMVVGGLIYGFDRIVQIEQQVPTQVAELFPTLAVEWDLAGRIRTPTPGGATATPTKTPVPATATATPGGVPTLTPAPVTSTPVVSSTPVAGGCDETKWHEPLDLPGCHHHHGVDVMNGIDPESGKTYEELFAVDGFSIRAWFTEHGQILQPASVTLNENPNGRIFFYVQAKDNCEKDFEGIATPVPNEYACVIRVVYGVHAMGHLSHLLGNGLSTHSEVYVAVVCTTLPDGKANLNDCSIAAGAVQITYGPTHADYKDDICYMANAPVGYPLSQINQPPYNTILPLDKYDPERNPGVIQSYWVNSDPNPNIAQYYPPGTNSIMNSAWLELDVWSPLPKELVCGQNLTVEETKAILNEVEPVLTDAHRTFKINDFTLLIPHMQTPFDGFVNAQGQVVDISLCGQEGQVCWPLLYTDGYPMQKATLHRGAEPGGCEPDDENPCIIFTFSVEMIFPLWDIAPGQEGHDH